MSLAPQSALVNIDFLNNAVEKAEGGVLETWVIIPRPHPNVCAILPIDYTPEAEPYRAIAEGIAE